MSAPVQHIVVPALTIRQPWASLIIRGGKDIENRNWPTSVRGTVAIHSSARMTRDDMDDACEVMERFIPKFNRHVFMRDKFPLGSILGTVEIVGCVRESTSPWFFGEYGFVLKNARGFEPPIPAKGALGFWKASIPVDYLKQGGPR